MKQVLRLTPLFQPQTPESLHHFIAPDFPEKRLLLQDDSNRFIHPFKLLLSGSGHQMDEQLRNQSHGNEILITKLSNHLMRTFQTLQGPLRLSRKGKQVQNGENLQLQLIIRIQKLPFNHLLAIPKPLLGITG
ncbi:hypothetical protein D3C75_749210 [compost metagenome]